MKTKTFKERVLNIIQFHLGIEEKKLKISETEYRKRLHSSKIALLRDLYDTIKLMDDKE